MTAQEKQDIYNLLKTASSCIYGYKSPDFDQAADQIGFKDDLILEPEILENKVPQTENNDNEADANNNSLNQEIQPKAMQILEKAKSCGNCMLKENRGSIHHNLTDPLVLVIKESPETPEMEATMLTNMLKAVSLSDKVNCCITSLVKCIPPQGRLPMKDETEACSGFLDAEIHALKPKAILALGRITAQFMLKTQDPLSALHGKMFSYNGIPFMATLSPKEMSQDINLKKHAWADLQQFAQRLREIDPHYEATFRNNSAN